MTTGCTLQNLLPIKMWEEVYSKLTIADLANVALVSKESHNILKSDFVAKRVLEAICTSLLEEKRKKIETLTVKDFRAPMMTEFFPEFLNQALKIYRFFVGHKKDKKFEEKFAKEFHSFFKRINELRFLEGSIGMVWDPMHKVMTNQKSHELMRQCYSFLPAECLLHCRPLSVHTTDLYLKLLDEFGSSYSDDQLRERFSRSNGMVIEQCAIHLSSQFIVRIARNIPWESAPFLARGLIANKDVFKAVEKLILWEKEMKWSGFDHENDRGQRDQYVLYFSLQLWVAIHFYPNSTPNDKKRLCETLSKVEFPYSLQKVNQILEEIQKNIQGIDSVLVLQMRKVIETNWKKYSSLFGLKCETG